MKPLLLLSVLLVAALLSQPAAARVVAAEEVCSAARELLSGAGAKEGVNVSVECPHARSVEALEGTLAWALVGKRDAIVAGSARVVMQLSVNGQAPRDVGVPVVLSVTSKAWVAAHDLRPGDRIEASDIEWRAVQWPVGTMPAHAASVAPSGRARIAIKAGDVIVATQLTPDRERLQGDVVKVSLRSGGVTLESPAVLTANARIGQTARVQLKGRHDTLEGVLVDASTVIVEH